MDCQNNLHQEGGRQGVLRPISSGLESQTISNVEAGGMEALIHFICGENNLLLWFTMEGVKSSLIGGIGAWFLNHLCLGET